MDIKTKNLPKSETEVEFELTLEEFNKYIEKALVHLKQHIKVDGFRQGKTPDNIAKEKIGEQNLLMEAGDMAVKDVYYKYIQENKLEPIGEPNIEIIKITKGSEFIFKAKFAVLPEIDLPDYKEIAKKVKAKDILVDKKEIEDAINYLQKTRAKFFQQDKIAQKNDFVEIEYSSKDINEGKLIKDKFVLGEGGMIKSFEENIIGMKAGQEKEFSVDFPDLPAQAGNSTRKDLAGRPKRTSPLAGKKIDFKAKMISVQKMELPEINDEFAKGLGAFDTLTALKESVKTGILKEKTEEEKQRKRGEILELIAQKSKVELPEKLVQKEQESLFENLKNNVAQKFKISFEEYLATIKKSEQELKETFKMEAEKRLKSFLVLREIGKKENIEVDEKEIEEETKKVLATYNKEQIASIDPEQIKEYTKGVIFNEKIFQLLEKLSQ